MENRDVAGQQSQENMAEAAVESPHPRFFCHNCTSEIRPVLPDYICPQCEMGFIEEVSTNPPEPSEESDDDAYNSSSQSEESVNSLSDLWNMLSYMRRPEDATRGVIQFPPVFAAQPGVSRPGPSRRIRYRLPNRRSSTSDTDSNRRTEGFLHQLVTTLSENSGVVTNASFPVFLNLHSNPGDYAWGRGGFNAILSQLINQLDGTGPPPLPKDKIDEIPTVNISQEQVDKNLQCTVCMEDFQLEEPVRRLNCDHHYHEGCIIPWLELHGTCPICRKLLNENASSQENMFSTSPSGTVADMVELPGLQTRPLNAHTADSDADGMSRRTAGYDPLLPSVYDFTDEFD